MHRILADMRCLLCGVIILLCQHAAGRPVLWSPSQQMSSSTISAIAQDHNGYIWVGTEYGLNRYDGFRYTYYLANADDSTTINDNTVTTLYVDRRGTLWVGTRQGLNRYDADRDAFTAVHFDIEWQPRIQQLFVDSDGVMWCATSGYGLWRIDGNEAEHVVRNVPDGEDDYYQVVAIDLQNRFWTSNQRGEVKCLRRMSDGNDQTLASCVSALGDVKAIIPHHPDTTYMVCQYGVMCYDGTQFSTLANTRGQMELTHALRQHDGSLLVGTQGHGLWQYRPGDGRSLVPVECSVDDIDPSLASVSAMYEDRSGNVWVGCYHRGLMALPSVEPPSQTWNFTDHQMPTSSELTSVAPVGSHELLVTLSGYGLYHLRPNQPMQRVDALRDATCVLHDAGSRYWVSTSDQLYAYDQISGRAQLLLNAPRGNVRKLIADKQGRVYLSTFGQGLCVYDPATGRSWQYDMYHPLGDDENDRLRNDWVLDLLTDSRGNVWCATASGICCYDPRSQTFCPYGWSVMLNNHLCQCLAEDSAGNILVGTHDGLYIYDLRTRMLTEVELPGLGLMSRSICGLMAMPDRKVWMSTSRGIWVYDQESGELRSCECIEGAHDHEYNPGVATQLDAEWIVFGEHDGLLAFDTQVAWDYMNSTSADSVVLTAFLLGNDVVKPGTLSGGRPIYDCNVTKAHEFVLAYDDNTFSLEFSPMTYDLLYRPRLQYSLNGDHWLDAPDKSNAIAFNHLPPGEYRLHVRQMEKDVASAIGEYTIRILPPWYASALAQTVYALLLLAFLASCLWVWIRHKRTQVEDEKMQLLIDATHDIRTPLTLILSPLHQLNERYQDDADTSRKLQTIGHNARRILTLVNQILDVRRYDKQQMPFHPQLTDLPRFVADNLQGFAYEAQQRHIALRVDLATEESPFNVAIDRTQFEKVIVNLVGNALKFTADGGTIDLQLTREGNNAVLRVSDTGVGLPDGETERIFHRFYQPSTSLSEGGEGTGIGLNLCLKVMQLHQGSIAAANRKDGLHGSVFTLTLPLDADYAMALVNATADATAADSQPAADGQPTVEGPNTEPNVKNPVPADGADTQPVRQPSRSQRILLVDDDHEITDYITQELAGRYRFQSCSNGLEALQQLLADPTRYDVLVSDIMMPEMDGLTLLRSIKSNNLIAHIPVVLLTSKSEISNRLEGLSAGADAYMAKPFVIDELCATLDGLIANTLRQRSKFTGNVEAAKAALAQESLPAQALSADSDSRLLERIVKVVNQHLSESEFGVDQLCVEVGVSRSQLHRKMKELTGIGAGEFVRNLRLEQAARLLKETDMNVSQVAYAVGFSNLGHFSKIFRTHFGVYPSEYNHS